MALAINYYNETRARRFNLWCGMEGDEAKVKRLFFAHICVTGSEGVGSF